LTAKISRKPPILHPFLFALYPILAILALNIEETNATTAVRPIGISLFSCILCLILFRMITKNWYRAGIITSILLVWFFSYGHVYNYFEGLSLFGFTIGRHRYLALLWLCLGGISIWWAARQLQALTTSTKFFNVIAITVIIWPTAQLTLHSINTYRAEQEAVHDLEHDFQIERITSRNQPTPDIYYIILDGYARDDILAKHYGIDNTPFLEELEEMGFYIARCSQSNYAQTQLSLASSLNFDYLEKINDRYAIGNKSRLGLNQLIRENKTRELLSSIGYTVIAFDSGYEPTRLKNADIYLSPGFESDINDFENLLIRTTLGRIFTEGIAFINLPPDWEKRDQAHRERILFTLEQLNNLPEVDGPKFVFVHLIIPHWPHVFGPEGQPVHENPDSITGYRSQVQFINAQIIPIIDNLLADHELAPIVIIQGDHGSIIESPKQRMSILNAYKFPEMLKDDLYPGVSPVNTFRMLFNHLLGSQYELLEDRALYSTYDNPYEYQLILNDRHDCQPGS